MTVTLNWQGPVGPGRFPEDPLLFERLCDAGVYLRVKTYPGGRVVAYVGQSASLLARFDQRLSSMMSLGTPLRDATGKVVFLGDAAARIGAYQNLDDVAALAAADTQRVKFWYAQCDEYFHTEHMSLVEGLLQRRIAVRLTDVENAVATPGRMPDDIPDRWQNDFSGLGAGGRDVLTKLLGTEPMALPETRAVGD